jgi:hypothetical protein
MLTEAERHAMAYVMTEDGCARASACGPGARTDATSVVTAGPPVDGDAGRPAGDIVDLLAMFYAGHWEVGERARE